LPILKIEISREKGLELANTTRDALKETIKKFLDLNPIENKMLINKLIKTWSGFTDIKSF
jgi:hypothetical protein